MTVEQPDDDGRHAEEQVSELTVLPDDWTLKIWVIFFERIRRELGKIKEYLGKRVSSNEKDK
jgi:hypothetical protein